MESYGMKYLSAGLLSPVVAGPNPGGPPYKTPYISHWLSLSDRFTVRWD
ncbi:MAG: hypothetical protein F7B11_04660 [Caldisphaeraceae archaeon]|nr:hypothetical protein [Caldisphaeraceae archaeon]